jgi:hypothetical protein
MYWVRKDSFCCTIFLLYSLLISLLIFGSIALKMDFQKYSFTVPDSFYMLSPKFWIFLTFMYSLLLVFFFKARDQFFNALVITTAYIFIIFPFVQWPNVMGFDQFLHTSTARLVENGLLADRSTEINDVYLDYPITSILQSTFKVVTGFDYIFGATVLAFFIKAFTVLILYVMSARIFGKKLSYLVVLLFLISDFRFNQYYQFAPQAVAFSLFILLLYAYMKSDRNRSFLILMLLSYGLIVLAHPYTSFFALATLSSIFLIEKVFPKKTRPTLSSTILIFVIILWVFWQLYPALPSFNARSSYAFTMLTDVSKLQDIFEEAKTVGRAVYSSILLNYQIGLQISLTIASIYGIIIARNHIPKILLALLVGFVILIFQLIITSRPPQLIALDKLFYFGTLPAAFLAFYSITKMSRTRILHTFVPVFAVVISALIPMSFFASNQFTYMDSIKTWEMESTSFAATHIPKAFEKKGTMDSVTSKVYTYYSYDVEKTKPPFGLAYYSQRNLDDPNDLNINADVVFLTFRQKVDWYYNQGTTPGNWDNLESSSYQDNPSYNKFYDDYYTSIYVK